MNKKIVFSLWVLIALLSWKLSLRFSMGAYHISFSCLSVTLPIIGVFLSRRASSLWSMSGWYLAHLAHLPITLGIPTYFATLSWNASDRRSRLALHVLLPLACMGLFCLKAAQGSWPYALYWLIPPVLHFLSLKSLPARALQNTFVAHAVGSAIWVYFIPMTASAWLGLIPVVAIERLSMAFLSASLVWMLEKAEQLSPQSRRIA